MTGVNIPKNEMAALANGVKLKTKNKGDVAGNTQAMKFIFAILAVWITPFFIIYSPDLGAGDFKAYVLMAVSLFSLLYVYRTNLGNCNRFLDAISSSLFVAHLFLSAVFLVFGGIFALISFMGVMSGEFDTLYTMVFAFYAGIFLYMVGNFAKG